MSVTPKVPPVDTVAPSVSGTLSVMLRPPVTEALASVPMLFVATPNATVLPATVSEPVVSAPDNCSTLPELAVRVTLSRVPPVLKGPTSDRLPEPAVRLMAEALIGPETMDNSPPAVAVSVPLVALALIAFSRLSAVEVAIRIEPVEDRPDTPLAVAAPTSGIWLATAWSEMPPVTPATLDATKPSVPPPFCVPGLTPSVTAPVVCSSSPALTGMVTVSPALAMLIAPVVVLVPSPNASAAVMRLRKTCDRDSEFGSAAVAPISSIRREAVSGAKVTTPCAAEIPPPGLGASPTASARKVSEPDVAVTRPEFLPKSSVDDVASVKLPADWVK